MLDVINVQFGYSKAVDFNYSYKFDLELPVVIHGPSGSGKSTFLNVISGLVTPFSGSIKYEGQDLFELSPAERHLSILFQRGNLFDHISCFRNVEIGLNSKIDKKYSKSIIEDTFDHLGITPLLNKLPSEISGGQRKRVALARVIARAKCLNKKLLLLDEPFNGLDIDTKVHCIKILSDLQFNDHCKIIIISHDINDPASLGGVEVNLDDIQGV